MRNIIIFMLEEIKSRMRDIVIFWKEIKFRKCWNVIISFKKSIVNENRLSNACNQAHNCQNDDFETIKKKKNIFSKT